MAGLMSAQAQVTTRPSRWVVCVFFFQAEDGIRDYKVTGVQTCALPICADLANLVNEAALNAARYNQKVVRMHDFEFAKDKVLMGSERRSMIISDAEKRVTAIHEAGHALLTVLLPHADPIHKVTIIPRGMALGLTQQLPTDEKHNYSRDYLNDQIAILLGGRIAEEITMDSLTTGAGNDLERATELSRRMVCEWGMSDAMGPPTFGKIGRAHV